MEKRAAHVTGVRQVKKYARTNATSTGRTKGAGVLGVGFEGVDFEGDQCPLKKAPGSTSKGTRVF